MAKLSKVKQDELIKVEVERYNKIFEYLQEDKKRIAQRLIERVAFMTIQLQILEDNIKQKDRHTNLSTETKNDHRKSSTKHITL